MRRLEHAVLERLTELNSKHQVLFADSRINIENFYGIEIDDFAVEVAILSLWIAKHQMNAEFKAKFGPTIPLIPLKETGRVVAGNATRVDWNAVCPNNGTDEIYLISNPPYVGSSMQTAEQKSEFKGVFGVRAFSKNLDYISLWFVKGADYIAGTKAELAFVTTNSVAQGEHVGLMFPTIFATGVEIGFAYTSFKWENNAKRNAGVTVAVISLRNPSRAPKYIYTDDVQIAAQNINGYLADGPSITMPRRMKPLSNSLPPMAFGSKPTDGGWLILDATEKERQVTSDARSSEFIKKYVGSDELINGSTRFCIWVEDVDVAKANAIPSLADRFERVRNERLKSKAKSTVEFANRPHRFKQRSYRASESIIVPAVSSENRDYIPIDYVSPDIVANNRVYAVYDASPWTFALLNSRMHMTWTRAVSGRFETRFSYGNTIVYNNFPVPPLSDAVKERLTEAALRILDVREYHCERTLAELYDPDKMPDDLHAAHKAVDDLVDSIYSKKGYETDEERLSDLFTMYEEMTAAEAARGAKGSKK